MEETNNKDVKFKCTSEGLLPLRELEVTIKARNLRTTIFRSLDQKKTNATTSNFMTRILLC